VANPFRRGRQPDHDAKQAAAQRTGDRVRLVVRAELVVDPMLVMVNRAQADAELARNAPARAGRADR